MKTLIRTYENDIHIIDGKTPAEILSIIKDQDFVQMPNGSIIHRKSIAALQTYEDYTFQVDQKNRHKKGQFLKSGEWNDEKGIICTADLFRITGEEIKQLL